MTAVIGYMLLCVMCRCSDAAVTLVGWSLVSWSLTCVVVRGADLRCQLVLGLASSNAMLC